MAFASAWLIRSCGRLIGPVLATQGEELRDAPRDGAGSAGTSPARPALIRREFNGVLFRASAARAAEETQLLERALSLWSGSRTATALFGQLRAQNVPLKASFGEIASSIMAGGADTGVLVGVEAYTVREAGGGRHAVINRRLLDLRLPRRDLELRVTKALAHELLGHGLGGILAERAGLWKAYVRWEGNETNALLIEGIVGLELGARDLDPWLLRYLRVVEQNEMATRTPPLASVDVSARLDEKARYFTAQAERDLELRTLRLRELLVDGAASSSR